MRRCLRSLLVGVLSLSFTVDAARACGHLRRAWCCPPCPVPPVATFAWNGCVPPTVVRMSPVAFDDGICGGGIVLVLGYEEIGCGTPLECCGWESTPSPAVAHAPAAAGESVVVRPPASPVVVPPSPAEPSAPVASTVPELRPVEPVKPASGAEEAVDLVPETVVEDAARGEDVAGDAAEKMEAEAVEQQAETGAPGADEPPAVERPVPQPEPPPRRNIFEQAEESERAAETGPSTPPPATDEEAAAAAGAADPAPETDDAPVAPATEVPVPDDPAVEPEADPEPSSPGPSAAAEPMRRWIDDTASFAVVGRLVDVQGDAAEILKVDGRLVTVPLARLSRFDRDYVEVAGPRIVAARQGGPRSGDTASR